MLAFYLATIDSPTDRNKFEILYQKYRQFLFYRASQILGNTSDSEDIVHDVYLKLIEIIDKIGDPDSPQTKALLAIIVENKAIDLYRRRQSKSISSLDDTLCKSEDSGTDIESSVLDRHTIAMAIAALPSKYRAVLILKYSQGFSTSEIGTILSMSAENVKKALQRARQKLKDNLKGEKYLNENNR